MTNFIQFCTQLSPLDPPAKAELNAATTSRLYQKQAFLLKNGQTCSQLYFINKGLVKLYFYRDDKECILRFFAENTLFTGLDSYLTRSPSQLVIKVLEPSLMTCIAHSDMEALCQKHHGIETVFRKFVSTASLNMIKRVGDMLEKDATERYRSFIDENHHLLSRISLGDLASYLGITQVSLSRIRAKK
ncbi:Crp/Fnr family transcriptional regulator [Spirosoma harenae]